MRKQLLILLSLLFISSSAICQDWQWAKEAGGTNFSESKSIATDDVGNSYVAGNFANSITIGNVNLSGSSAGSTFVAKYDSNGGLVWAKAIAGTSVVESMDIAVDGMGNAYLTGNFKGTVSVGNFTLTSPEDRSAFVAKLDQSGSVVWARQAGSTDGEVKGLNITVDINGNAYVTGNFDKSAKFGTTTVTATKDEQLFIAKYNSQGEVSWVKIAGGLGSCFTHGITTDKSGNVYLTGQFWLTAVFGSTTLSNFSEVTKPADIFIAKYDPNGNALWARQAGGTEGNDVAAGITVDADGNSYITGFYQNRATFGNTTITGNASGNIFLAKYNTVGSLQWIKKQEGSSDARGVSIDRDSNGNIYIAGHFEGSLALGNATLVSYGNYDMFFSKFDPNGNVTGAMQAGGEGMDLVKKIHADAGGSIYFVGNYTRPATFGATTLTAGIVTGKITSIGYQPGPSRTITTGALSSSTLCHGSTVEVPFSTTGTFGTDNVFTVQLSNSSGSFSYPVNLGSGITSPIKITIPAEYATGTGYRVRVVASSPVVTGTSNSTNLTLSKPPVVTASVSSRIIRAGASANLSASGADTYTWSPAMGLSNAHVANPVATPQTTTTYTVTGTKNGCTSTATITVRVEPLPPAGSALNWSWVKYGGATSNTEARATVVDAAGNVYVAGYFSDKVTFGSTTLSVPGYRGFEQLFIVKYNANGEVVWAKDIGGTNNDAIRDLALDKQGNLYITGWFDPAITIGSVTLGGDSNGSKYFVAKFSPDGEAIWANQIKGAHNVVMAVAGGPSGESYIAGTFRGTATFNELSLESGAINDYFLVKYDASGNVKWAESIGGTSVKGYRPMDLVTDSNGDVYATGSFNKGNLVFGSIELTNTIEYTNSFLAKYNPEGQVQWAKFIGQNRQNYDHTTSRYIAIDKHDKVYIAGEFNRKTTIDDVALTGASNIWDNFIAKFDTEGHLAWATEVGGGQLMGFTVDTEGFAYSTGIFSNAAVFGTRRLALDPTEFGTYVVKHDPDGNVVWAELAKAKRSWDVMSNGISVDHKQQVYIAGIFDRYGAQDPVTFGCHTIRSEISGAGHYYLAKLSPVAGEVPTLVTGNITNASVCAGATIEVPFSVTGTGSDCASFTVLLSDAKGSFEFAKIIGTGTGNSITATIPANTAAGDGYKVKVISAGPAITGIASVANITVAALPVVSISASVTTPCPGTTGITYTAHSTDQISSYTWSVPTGWAITAGQGTNRITVTAGTSAGEVKVTVRSVCSTEATKSLAVTPAYVPAPTLWDTSKTICGPSNAVFTASGAPFGATYRWYASATATEPIWEDRPSGSESRFYTPVVSETTYFYVSLRLSSGCEGERVQLTLNVNAKPASPGVVTASETEPCAGATVLYEVSPVEGALGYEWIVPNGWTIVSGQGTARISVRAGSTAGQVTVAAYNGCGLSVPQSLAVEVGSPPAPTVVAGFSCGAGTVTLTATSAPAGGTYKWYTVSAGGAAIATGGTYTTPMLSSSATYYVAAVNAGGCEGARVAVVATVNQLPTVQAGPALSVCTNASSFVLTGFSPANGVWSGRGVNASGLFEPAVAGIGAHGLTYTYTDSIGCTVSGSRTVTVLETPVVTLADFDNLCSTTQGHVLTGGQPLGGTYSGTGVVNGMFTPIPSVDSYPITYTYTTAAGCAVSVTKVLTVTTCTGIAESKSASKLILYPNPTKESFLVELPIEHASNLTLRLYDTKGRTMFERQYPKAQGEFKELLNLKGKAKGMYLLQLILEDGVITKRVVLE